MSRSRQMVLYNLFLNVTICFWVREETNEQLAGGPSGNSFMAEVECVRRAATRGALCLFDAFRFALSGQAGATANCFAPKFGIVLALAGVAGAMATAALADPS